MNLLEKVKVNRQEAKFSSFIWAAPRRHHLYLGSSHFKQSDQETPLEACSAACILVDSSSSQADSKNKHHTVETSLTCSSGLLCGIIPEGSTEVVIRKSNNSTHSAA